MIKGAAIRRKKITGRIKSGFRVFREVQCLQKISRQKKLRVRLRVRFFKNINVSQNLIVNK